MKPAVQLTRRDVRGALSRRLPRLSRRRRAAPLLPLRDWPPSAGSPRPLDTLTDEQITELNGLLPWSCFTVDSHGRRLGNAAWSGKRTQPQLLPDPRIERLHQMVNLSDKDVLEIGCFEGVHTIALCDRARSVVAVDARVLNVAKTATRCALYGVRPTLLTVDVEREPADSALWDVDVVHHVGVLYHLVDPVSHLRAVAQRTRAALLLDTHVARPEQVDEHYEADSGSYAVRRAGEGGMQEVFSGTGAFSRWLLLPDIRALLEVAGLTVVVEELREERNGDRVLIIARR